MSNEKLTTIILNNFPDLIFQKMNEFDSYLIFENNGKDKYNKGHSSK